MPRLAAVLWLSFLLSPLTQAQTAPPKFEAGAQFTTLHLTGEGGESTFGAGVRFVYNPVPFFSVDSELNYTFPDPSSSTSRRGGHLVQGFIGAKAGLRKSRIGIFGKARPGFASFDAIVKSIDLTTFRVELGRRTQFALDLGGVFEIYASRRLSVRYDVGKTIIHYGRQFVIPSSPFHAETKHNFQFSSGILFRF